MKSIIKIGELLNSKTIVKIGLEIRFNKQKRNYHLAQKKIIQEYKLTSEGECPHLLKQEVILKAKEKYELNTLIETGTFLGEMMAAMSPHFEKLYSIELSEFLWEKAIQRFNRQKNVNIIQGDSGVKLAEIVSQLEQPAIFWLDGHYSGGVTAKGEIETPIYKELETVFSSRYKFDHVVLIDDARLFNGTRDYPKVEDLKKWLNDNYGNYHFQKHYDTFEVKLLKNENK